MRLAKTASPRTNSGSAGLGRRVLIATAATLCLGLAAASPAAAAPAATPGPGGGFFVQPPKILLGCDIKLSQTQPKAGSVVTAFITQVGTVRVNVSAKYGAGEDRRVTKGSATGTAKVTFKVRPTAAGVAVPVTVSATAGSVGWTCSTVFVPR